MPDDASPGLAELHAALAAAEARIAQLEQIIHDLQRARFGQSAERVDPGQLALALGTAAPPLPTVGGDTPAPDRKPAFERRRNRGCLPAHLERIEEVIDIADRACPCCQREMHRVGEDRAERLDVVPTQLRVRVTIRLRKSISADRCVRLGYVVVGRTADIARPSLGDDVSAGACPAVGLGTIPP